MRNGNIDSLAFRAVSYTHISLQFLFRQYQTIGSLLPRENAKCLLGRNLRGDRGNPRTFPGIESLTPEGFIQF